MKHHRKFRTICAALAFVVTVSIAGTVDDYFGKGVLGLKWGATLSQVQEKFPGGVTYPTQDERGGTRAVYHVPVESKAIGIELPPSLAMFEFTGSEKLRAVTFHFSYLDRDTVLYQVAAAIGQNYQTQSYDLEDVYRWKAGGASSVALNIGRASPHTWVFLLVESRK